MSCRRSSVTDRRRQVRHATEEHRAHWLKMNKIVASRPHLLEPQRESHCREAVMWWVHHLTGEKREVLRARNITIPLLPEGAKKQCGRGEGPDEHDICVGIEQPNSCDWCHSTQAAHDAGLPGTSAPDALNPKFHGPDDGNLKGWDSKRRCDQDQMPRCGLCEGIGGRAFSDKNDDIDMTPCEVVAEAKDVDNSTVAPPLYPKAFTVKRKDGSREVTPTRSSAGRLTLLLWFLPDQGALLPHVKYYDISWEATRSDYNIRLTGAFSVFPNTSAIILQVNDNMWIQNHLWAVDQCICANPSGNHCSTPPCKSYVWHWDTFRNAQYLGREKIGVEWIQNHGVGNATKIMELDQFILWTHHAWTDPVSNRIVRMWKPFNGLQNYDPEAWTDSVEDPDTVFQSPPPKCKKGGAKIRIKCDDDGLFHPSKSEGLEHLDELYALAVKMQQQQQQQLVV